MDVNIGVPALPWGQGHDLFPENPNDYPILVWRPCAHVHAAHITEEECREQRSTKGMGIPSSQIRQERIETELRGGYWRGKDLGTHIEDSRSA